MESMQKVGNGRVPEYGAIFMSNSVTKEECLRRNLFGLPSKNCQFVKQIKAGMILFLFEHENRQLHGVFEACSDGAMNIVPHAYRTYGIDFPAQVKVKSIWICDPLSEGEFRDAIIENYFTPYKFNFGLSEVQVRRLLQLFSRKKVRALPRSTKTRHVKSTVFSTDKGKQVDDELVYGFNSNDIEVRSATRRRHRGLCSDSEFLRNYEFENEHSNVSKLRSAALAEHSQLDKVNKYNPDNEFHSAIPDYHSEYYPEYVKGVPRDDEFPVDGEFQRVYVRRDDFEPSVIHKLSSSYQSKLGRSILSGEHLELRSVPDKTTIKPYSTHHQMQGNISTSSHKVATFGDSVAMTTQPDESVAPSINYFRTSVDKVSSQPLAEGYQPCFNYFYRNISSKAKQPPSLYTEGIVTTQSLDTISRVRNHNSFSALGTGNDISPKEFSKYSEPVFENKFRYGGFSSSKYSPPEMHSLRTRVDLLSPGTNYTSSEGYGYPVEPEDQPQTEAARKRKMESVVCDIASTRDYPLTLQARFSSINPQQMQDYEKSLLKYGREVYQSSGRLNHTLPRGSRSCVFSRLAPAQDELVPVHDSTNDVYEGKESSVSVDEIMEVLHDSHRQWVKSSERLDDVEKFTTKKKKKIAGFHRQEDCKISDFSEADMKMVTFSAKRNPTFNFKRRSEVRKLRGNGIAADCDASLGSEHVKKRKLVRPDFGTKCHSVLSEPAEVISTSKNNSGGCEAVIEYQVDKNIMSLEETLEHRVFESENGEGSCVGNESLINSVNGQNGTILSANQGKKMDTTVQESILMPKTRNECASETFIGKDIDMLNCSFDEFQKIVKRSDCVDT